MAITQTTISGTGWTAVSSAGESGTCWLRVKPGRGSVILNHSDSGTSGFGVLNSYYMSGDRSTVVDLVADSASDVFYGKCTNSNGTAIVVTDMV